MNWIAVAGPYATGGADAGTRVARLRAMNEAAATLFDRGWIPVIGVNMALPMIAASGEDRYAEIMQPLSNTLVARCDAILRIGGRPVYRRLEDVPPPDAAPR